MSKKRTVLNVALEPLVGSRFQPTGFPDLGAAVYERPKGNGVERMLLVESAQSMANRLEGTAWDLGAQAPVDIFAELPFVRVSHAEDGRFLTSSRTEAHRLASAFVRNAELDGTPLLEIYRDRFGLLQDSPTDHRAIANAVFGLDPFCLVHGVFFADPSLPGQPKVARAITGLVEARNVREAVSGGVKRDHVRHSTKDEKGGAAEGYGSVPFSRIEFTAEEITASFVIDLAQLDSYGLPQPARDLLEAIAEWEIQTLLDDELRFRTACDLKPVHDGEIEGIRPLSELEALIPELIAGCDDLLTHRGPIDVVWNPKKVTEKNPKKSEAS